MPTASQRILLDFFENDLPFTPTAGQIDQFERDLALVSPYLMKAALKEAVAGTAFQQGSFAERRAAIFRIYYRKVAEHAQLFPVFHTFETAFRSTLAVEMEAYYSKPDWWAPVRNALRAGDPANSVNFINGVAISSDTARSIGQIIYAIEGQTLGKNHLGGLTDGYLFAEMCDLSHISDMIDKHWALFSQRYFNLPRAMHLAEFRAKFKKVRTARNDIYHHKSVANMTGVVNAAEELLDRLQCSMGFSYGKITGSKIAGPTFVIHPTTQHNLW